MGILTEIEVSTRERESRIQQNELHIQELAVDIAHQTKTPRMLRILRSLLWRRNMDRY